ncbi:glycerophosphodiester phosphodiesterase [Caldibacillus lycopersici]|uniref:Glycerophosphodiester phosphodiesterase n=1 Tax=Perspicuibacillus lycopersici TaxID=1325689 RepID=A0AAE3IRT2_9BACI|nr:glycerophosphodiester phosphodiesterase [Perspicuibacillus lycopersici]MCU9613430.1 glycerophosphodiester phosphodiesterase [Perspicuibacillus lycopersici]
MKKFFLSKSFKIVAILLILYFVNWLIPSSKTNLDSSWFPRENEGPLVIAHQAGNQERPSSTNLAFEHAIAIGADILEFDVALTKDNQLVTIHDLTVDRTTDGSGKVREHTYEEIKALNAGYGLEDENGQPIRDASKNPYIETGAYIPNLEEIFTKYSHYKMVIELKDSGEDGKTSAKVFWNLVKKYNMEKNVVVACFDKDTLKELRRLSNDKLITSASEGEMYPFYAFHRLGLPALNNFSSFEMLHIPVSYTIKGIKFNLLTDSLLQDAHKRNMAVYYWTINDADQMRELIEMGVDGIMTDHPELLIQVLKEEGIR